MREVKIPHLQYLCLSYAYPHLARTAVVQVARYCISGYNATQEDTGEHVMASKTVSVRLKSETLEKLGAMAEAMHRPRAWLMAHAIERYIAHEAWQVTAIQVAMDELDTGHA